MCLAFKSLTSSLCLQGEEFGAGLAFDAEHVGDMLLPAVSITFPRSSVRFVSRSHFKARSVHGFSAQAGGERTRHVFRFPDQFVDVMLP